MIIFLLSKLQRLKTHITFKIVTLTLALAILTPTTFKFIHFLKNHKHELCKGEYQVHLHASDFDCSYSKFKLSTPFTVPEFSVDFFKPDHNHSISIVNYLFLNDYREFQFTLRGPPNLI